MDSQNCTFNKIAIPRKILDKFICLDFKRNKKEMLLISTTVSIAALIGFATISVWKEFL